ncbi:BrnA antitoxin family protein [Methylocucumis oryzae]|uniref:BrnA antitoxin family protein n=1 Tax=Methylocucumis oryzae TaxID=1632867 RepID=UPI0012FF4CFD
MISIRKAETNNQTDWEDAFACHNAHDLHNETTYRACGAGKHPIKEQVAIRFDAEVLADFRASKGW